MITKVTDGVRFGDNWRSARLNNLEVQLVERIELQSNFLTYSDSASHNKWWSSDDQVMIKYVPRGFQTSWLYSIKIWVRMTSQGFVQSPSITKYGHKIQWLNTYYTVTTGHVNDAVLGGEFETNWYVKCLPKNLRWNGCVWHFRERVKKNTAQNTHTHTHLASYTLVKIKLSLGVHKIAGRDKTTEWIQVVYMCVYIYIYIYGLG